MKKGAKAMYILVPRLKKVEDEDSGEEDSVLIGFLAEPVFRIEDTDGEPLPECEPPQIPRLQSRIDVVIIRSVDELVLCV